MSRRILFGIMLIIGIHAFDELVLVISLPAIAPQLGLENLYGITIAGYILAAITGMGWSGRLIDSIGPRRVLNLGLTFFISGLLVSTVAWEAYSFIGARILQGLGGGMCVTCAFALINLLNDNQKKSKAITAIDVAWVLPSLAAPGLGGLLVDHFNWRWIFILQIPILVFVSYLFMSKLQHLDQNKPLPNAKSLLDALRIAIGTGLFLAILAEPVGLIWVFLILALYISIRPFNRIMPRDWWKGSNLLTLPILVSLLSFTAFYAMEVFQPLFLIESAGLSTSHAGFIVSFASVSWLTGSFLSSRIYPKLSRTQLMILGNVLLFLGIVCLGVITVNNASIILMYPSWALAGLGMGFTFNATRTLAMENTPENQEGKVATAITLASNMGIALSSGFGGAIKNQTLNMNGDLRMVLAIVVLMGVLVTTYSIVLMFYQQNKSLSKPELYSI